ncbi:MAG: hypothetical protein IT529_21790 [Burkholderiales bacterium]|nr:hypothetical protein [Burkholderiales bacterium]
MAISRASSRRTDRRSWAFIGGCFSLLGRLSGGIILALALAFAVPLAAAERPLDFTFGALGDAPYSTEDEPRFVALIAELNREELALVIHVGDFKAAWTPCSDEIFRQRRQWFDLSRHPLVFVPGDNEWTDCRRALGESREPAERINRLRELFFAGDASLGQRPIALARQHGTHDYPEHARWEHRGVTFVTLNAPGPDNNARADPAEHAARTAAMREWISAGFRQARARKSKAVVLAMHANPWTASSRPRRGFREVLATLGAETRAFAGAVLLLHGDTHQYRADGPPFDASRSGEAAPNFTRVEVFGYPAMNWVRIRVREEGGRVRFEAEPGS